MRMIVGAALLSTLFGLAVMADAVSAQALGQPSWHALAQARHAAQAPAGAANPGDFRAEWNAAPAADSSSCRASGCRMSQMYGIGY